MFSALVSVKQPAMDQPYPVDLDMSSDAIESLGEMPSKLMDQLLAAYCFTYAPFVERDVELCPFGAGGFTELPSAVHEIRRLRTLADAGLESLEDVLIQLGGLSSVTNRQNEPSTKDGEAVAAPSEAAVALTIAAGFARRIASLSTKLEQLCMHAAERTSGDLASFVNALERRIKNGDACKMYSSTVGQHLDLSKSIEWWMPLEEPIKNRVEFKDTAAVISEGKVEEQALIVTEVRRKKQRNPTGFQKFNFKDLRVEEHDLDSDSRRSRTSSARGASTDDASTRGSLSGVPGVAGGGTLTSRSLSSAGEENDPDDADDRQMKAHLTSPERNASVVFLFEQERQVIQDDEADPQWEEQQRHQKRFSRIRNRVPTGHQKILQSPFDEIAGLVNDYGQELSCIHLDTETAENTELNKCVVPAPIELPDVNTHSIVSPRVSQKRNVTIADDTTYN